MQLNNALLARARAETEQQFRHKLTLKQKRFIDDYLKSGNATQSYLHVYGCSQNTARANSHILLAKPNIKKYIKEIQSIESIPLITDRVQVLNRAWILANSTIGDGLKIRTQAYPVKRHGKPLFDFDGKQIIDYHTSIGLDNRTGNLDGVASIKTSKHGVKATSIDRVALLELILNNLPERELVANRDKLRKIQDELLDALMTLETGNDVTFAKDDLASALKLLDECFDSIDGH